LRILLAHNYYQNPGGEDTVVRAEKRLLTAFGHQVIEYVRPNHEISGYGLWGKAMLAPRTVWAWDSYREIRELLEREKPAVAHFHNTLPMISPAAYYACRRAGVPVVQTLHNYRLFCPVATFSRNGRVCEACVEDSLWRGVAYGCYRDSRAATGIVALMLGVHRRMGTWTSLVDCYIALTKFAQRKFIQCGLPAGKVYVKPNFAHPDPQMRNCRGEGALFVGQLRAGKGLRTLLTAWTRLDNRRPLTIVGEGPLRTELEDRASALGLSGVSFTGQLAPDDVRALMKRSQFLIFPSECYETFGMTIAEAFASGMAVIASRLGAMEEIVKDGHTGLHFTPGDAEDLATKVEWAGSHPKEMEVMGREARGEYEAKYTAERNYPMLIDIYKRALATHQRNSRRQQAVCS
jgi:glycosyltransferase involved in cell wall biosynthesis